jgi:hypothetical protein
MPRREPGHALPRGSRLAVPREDGIQLATDPFNRIPAEGHGFRAGRRGGNLGTRKKTPASFALLASEHSASPELRVPSRPRSRLGGRPLREWRTDADSPRTRPREATAPTSRANSVSRPTRRQCDFARNAKQSFEDGVPKQEFGNQDKNRDATAARCNGWFTAVSPGFRSRSSKVLHAPIRRAGSRSPMFLRRSP